MMLFGSGFIIEPVDFTKIESEILFTYTNGRDILQRSRDVKIIDFFGLSVTEAEKLYPQAYQWVLEKVKPERDANRDQNLRKNWWVFGRPRPELRLALQDIQRYIVTVETAKHRVFIFLAQGVIPDNKLIAIALDDAYFLGVLSSKIHVTWALAAGGTLGMGGVYVKTKCFDPFPFPEPTAEQKQKIRDLGEKLDAHRKQVQSQHPDVTITGMYNLLEKLRAGETFTDADRKYNDQALVSILKSIHDELDAAVFAAYGWSPNISDEQILTQLATLNAERAGEERNNLIRWLRPEYQAPHEVNTQVAIAGITTIPETTITPTQQQPFPKKSKEQLAAIRDLLRTHGGDWTLEQVMKQFKLTRGQKQVIGDHLESLEWFNILVSSHDHGVTCWRYVETDLAT
jgi:hypothetical protein